MIPQVRFARSGGVDIAYQVLGEGPVDLVFVEGFMSQTRGRSLTRDRAKTALSYRATVGSYITPAIGRVPLAKLQPEHVARMLADLTARGTLSPTTVAYARTILRIALGAAVKQGKVPRNVATLVDPPARPERELRPLSAAQVGKLLDTIRGDRLEALYTLAVATGLRQGEILALRWGDVDLDAGTLTVAHTLQHHDGAYTLAEPKTGRSRRALILGGTTLGTLRAHRVRQAAERLAAGASWHDQGLIFAGLAGNPIDGSWLTHRFQALLRQAGLPRQRFHDLRHCAATLMLEQGEELSTVSRILGHASIATTADIYAHLTPAMLQRSADRMDAVLRGGREGAAGGTFGS